jgi:lysophospholipase L1-like esterase
VPLGDSITEITCWRTLLWDALQADGVTNSFQFVGSMTDNTQNCQGNLGWDMQHEGHSGYLAINVANNNLVGWLISAKPDVVMFMLGTNDSTGGHTTAEVIAAYTKMVQEMRASNPNMKIIVS